MRVGETILIAAPKKRGNSMAMHHTDTSSGNFTISLDYELMWGVRDHATRENYGANVLGGREAIPAILDLFEKRNISATWATVGALLCESKDELVARAAHAELAPEGFPRFEEIGANERNDPYHYGASLARLIAACPGQEIGTHTFSHRCALEPGVGLHGFSADISAAITQLKEWKIDCKSIVFPRNQYNPVALEACGRQGLSHYRGNEVKWYYAPAPGKEQTAVRRLCRLIDSYIDLSGANVSRPVTDGEDQLINVASSRFLRPYAWQLAPLDGLRVGRITRAMEKAATTGGTFHLWWHPENFGRNLRENIAILTKVLDRFQSLKEEYGMQSRAMRDTGGPEQSCRAALHEGSRAA
jgi:peptidoglycan/xylan/chitin deacetylase (PgdA/CDA1 family)